jgi:ferredoxin-NADP reductase/pSer/pThr/pTyr-binding forkhead associated (FHA) protein/ferredoxin
MEMDMIKIKVIDPQKPDQIREVDLRPETMLNQVCLIGRFANCDLVLDSIEVSRMHGQFSKKNGTHYFTDLGSRCGSQINGKNVQVNQDYPLQQEDMIQIGRFFLKVLHLGFEEDITIPEAKISEEDKTILEPRRDSEESTLSLSMSQTKPFVQVGIPTQDHTLAATLDLSQLRNWVKGELTVRCIGVIDETHDVKTFRFVADPPVLFTYQPGQFVTLDLEINGEEVSRSYSISSTPSRPYILEITVKRLMSPPGSNSEIPPGLVSNWLYENVVIGSKIKLNGPRGKFTCFKNPSQKLLFISAGVGITPIMSMSRWLLDIGSHCDLIFFHCARTPSDIIFLQELELMSARYPNFHLAASTTRKEPGRTWLGLTGRLDATMLQVVAPDFNERSVYVCGPTTFMKSVKQMLQSLNFPMQNYYEESFGPQQKTQPTLPKPRSNNSSSETIGPPVAQSLQQMFRNLPTETIPESRGDNHSGVNMAIATHTSPSSESTSTKLATVVFARSEKEVGSDGKDPIIVLAKQQGIKIKSACLTGVCGSCKKRKLEGEVRLEGESEGLDESELQEGYILTCISYPVGHVVIDA